MRAASAVETEEDKCKCGEVIFFFFARDAERDGSRLCFPNCRLYMYCHLEGCTLHSWCKLKARHRNEARTKASQATELLSPHVGGCMFL